MSVAVSLGLLCIERGEVLRSVDKVSPALSNMGTSQSVLVGPKA